MRVKNKVLLFAFEIERCVSADTLYSDVRLNYTVLEGFVRGESRTDTI